MAVIQLVRNSPASARDTRNTGVILGGRSLSSVAQSHSVFQLKENSMGLMDSLVTEAAKNLT